MEAVIQGKTTAMGGTNKLFLDLKGIHCVPTGKQGGGARGYWYGKGNSGNAHAIYHYSLQSKMPKKSPRCKNQAVCNLT
jgi:hypothetical protein